MRLNARLRCLRERRLTAAVEALKTAFACLSADPTTTEGGDTCVKAAVALLFLLGRRSWRILHLEIVSCDLAMFRYFGVKPNLPAGGEDIGPEEEDHNPGEEGNRRSCGCQYTLM